MDFRKLTRKLVMGSNVLVLPLAILLLVQGHGWWALVAIITAHALWLIPTLWPACGWCGAVVTALRKHHASDGAKLVWLTIDDGPDADDTPRLLELLDQHGAKATFFFIGAKAAAHPELVADVIRRGHTVGNHTMNHSQHWFWAFGPLAVRREITECQRTLADTSGTAPVWFRAPAGLKNPFVHEVVERESLRLACWTARGLDGVDADKSRVLDRLKQAIRPGAIVLMHEGRLDDLGQRLAPQVLGDLLAWLGEEGYRCVLPEDEDAGFKTA
jgi:peptidoglycan/xylan/chitin deacetylase (PgdA/CDA1 family)